MTTETEQSIVPAMPQRFAITIPAAADTNYKTILDLLKAAGYAPNAKDPGRLVCWILASKVEAGVVADRAAFFAASKRPGTSAFAEADFLTHGQPVNIGQSYHVPSCADAASTALRVQSGAAAVASVIVL